MHSTASAAKRRHSLALRLKSALTLTLLAGLTITYSGGAFAAASDWRDYYTPRRAKARAEAAKPQQEMPAPMFAVISIADQRAVFYGADGVAAQTGVSTGMRGHATPTGVFSIVQKKPFHRSNLYSDAPMPFMQRITWSGIALHAGVLPGYPASHGCIRMPGAFAQRIYRATRMGQRVIISPTTVTPAAIAHKNLPAPLFVPAEEPAEAAVTLPETTATVAQNEPQGAGKVEAVSLLAAPVDVRQLNPLEVAQQLKQTANAKSRDAARAMKAAQLALVTKTADARMTARKLASAEAALRNAKDKVEAAAKRVQKAEAEKVDNEKARVERAEKAAAKAEAVAKAEAAKAEAAAAKEAAKAEAGKAEAGKPEGDAAEAQNAEVAKAETEKADAAKAEAATRIEAAKAEAAAKIEAAKAEDDADIARAIEAKTAAEAAVAEAQKEVDEALKQNEARQQDLVTARKMAEDAKAAGREGASLLAEANRRLRPLSVFISKKTGRLYVRQDFDKVFDAPVTISHPERPIGTHTFVSTKTVEDGSGLHWVGVTMPPEAPDAKPAPRADGKRGKGAAKDEAPAAAEPVPTFAPETAAGALDRITIPEDTAKRLAELSWVGATVIVSDHPISGETGDTTDFIILTKRTVAQQ